MKNNLLIILCFLIIGCSVMKVNDTYYKEYELVKQNNMLFVKVKVKDNECVLLIDTGASHSLLDINKAKKYKFKYYKTENKYIGIGGKADMYEVYKYKVDKFIIDFLAIDLSNISEYFSDKGNLDLVGVIGADFLSDHNALIDFENNMLYYKK